MLSNVLTWCLSWMIYLYGHTMFKSVDKPTTDYTKNLIAKQTIYNNTSQILEPVHFYVEDLQNDNEQLQMAQNFIKQSKPLKLSFRNNSNVFKDYSNFNENVNSEIINSNHTKMIVTLWMGYGSAYNTDFAAFARTLINEYPVSFLKFTGNYIAGGSHSDASISGCLNFYFLKQGEKKATLIPPEGGEYVDMYYDKHSVTPKDELYDISNTQWRNKLPSFYQFSIKSNEVIIFNNCDMLHHFEGMNVKEYGYPIAYSLRFTNWNRNEKDIARSNYHYTIKSNEFAEVMIDQLLQGTVVRNYRAR